MIDDPKKYTWKKENVDNVKEEPAVYQLYENDTLIYIGSTKDLSERFTKYWSTNFKEEKDTCKRSTTSYKREYVASEQTARASEKVYLLEYQTKNGRLPRCNEKII